MGVGGRLSVGVADEVIVCGGEGASETYFNWLSYQFVVGEAASETYLNCLHAHEL